MKKRYKLKNRRRFMITMAVFLSVIISVFLFATTKTKGYSEIKYKEVVISNGDTLWDIVVENYGSNSDIRKKVAVIRKANNMTDSEIFAGQTILLPEE